MSSFDQSHDDNGQSRRGKRSPLAGWLGLKTADVVDEHLPQIDVEAGLDRALRFAQSRAPQAQANARPAKSPISSADPVREALAAIEGALYTIDRVRDIIEQAYEVALTAQDVEDAGGRALLAESYDDLRLSISGAVEGVDERASTLVGRTQRQFDVKLGGKAHYSISPTRFDLSAKGLNLNPPRDAFATFEEINTILGELDAALKKADRAAANYCRDAQFLIARVPNEAA